MYEFRSLELISMHKEFKFMSGTEVKAQAWENLENPQP